MVARRLVAIGASSGGVTALQRLCAALPADFPAPILIVLHVGANRSVLPLLLTAASGRHRVVHAKDGQAIDDGAIVVAPPDHHMTVEGDRIRLSRSAKEHHTRPAIDPLFRSIALSHGPRAIGVVLTGRLDDGTAGLQAIKQCGGIAVVQDPSDAEYPDMPRHALAEAEVDVCVPLDELVPALRRLLAAPVGAEPAASSEHERLARESRVGLQTGDAMELLNTIGTPSTYSCPDCNGVLWQIEGSRSPRYRCHTGHGFSLRSLKETQASATEDALWSAIRALQQRSAMLRRLAGHNRGLGDDAAARTEEAEADKVTRQADVLIQLAESR